MDRVTGDWLDALQHACTDAVRGRSRIAALVAESIPSDRVIYTDVDFQASRFVLADELHAAGPIEASIMLTDSGMHPVIASYIADPQDRTPRRVSDVVPHGHWLETAAYREVFRPENACFQLSLVTTLAPPWSGSGWVLVRSVRDFTEADVVAARLLLPALVLAERLLAVSGRASGAGRNHPGLTPRESGVLALVASGWTAVRISRHLGISARTVEKHMENVYSKLGCNDRLLAVRKAENLGLIPMTAGG